MKLFFENPINSTTCTLVIDGTTLHKSTSSSEEKMLFDDTKELHIFVSKTIEGLMKGGYSQGLLPENRLAEIPAAKEYFADRFVPELEEGYGLEKRAGAKKTNPNTNPNSPFSRFTHLWDAYHFEGIRFGKMEFLAPPCEDFEASIINDQKLSTFTILHAFIGGFNFAKDTDSDDLLLAIPHEFDRERIELWKFDAQTHAPSEPLADDLSTWFYANHLLEESWYGADIPTLNSNFQVLQTRIIFPALCEKLNLSSHYESDSQEHAIYYHNRSYWLFYLLLGSDEVPMEEIADMFHIDIHTPQTWEKTRRFRFIRENPVTQLYWLWRLFWFDRKHELDECIALSKTSPSPLVLSAIKLIQSIQEGRKDLGVITDIHERRKKWIALGLDPAGSEEKLQEEGEKIVKLENDLAMAHEAIRSLSDKDLYKKCWDFVDNTNVMKVWLEHLHHSNEIPDDNLKRLESVVDI